MLTYFAMLKEGVSEEIFSSEEEPQPTGASSCASTSTVICVYSSTKINQMQRMFIVAGDGGEFGDAIARETV